MSCRNKNCTNPTEDNSEYCSLCRLMLQINEYDVFICNNCNATWSKQREPGEKAKTYQFDACEHCIPQTNLLFKRIKIWLIKIFTRKKKN